MPSSLKFIIDYHINQDKELRHIENVSFWLGKPKFILAMKPDDRQMLTQLVAKYLEKRKVHDVISTCIIHKKTPLLNQCLEAAQCWDEPYGGMASIFVQYHPYDAHWIAQARWSSGKIIGVIAEDPDAVLALLLAQLKSKRDGDA